MGFFSDDNIEYGVVVDIGSGSVLAAIVESDASKAYPEVVWSKREYAPLRQVDSLSNSVKGVMTALARVLMDLDSKGRTVFREKVSKGKLSLMQVTIAAPWSYTITKVISYKKKEEFTISRNFLEELLRTAEQKVQDELKENERIHNLGLKVISRITADVVANGYSVEIANKQKANSLRVVQLSAITQEGIVGEIEEMHDKLFPDTDLKEYSFMMAFFYSILELYPEQTECVLVDITYEATELGVVRDGVLQYCTHLPYGSFSLAREIAVILSVPLEEAHGYLSEPDFDVILDKYSERQKKEVQTVFAEYEKSLVELFHETGDKLSIPKGIFLHSNVHIAPLFKKILAKSASTTTKSSHLVYNVTGDLLTKYYPEVEQVKLKDTDRDTAMLISAQFFHTRNYGQKFEQL